MSSRRRDLLQQRFSLGALALLIDCDISDNDAIRSWLARVSCWNDRGQDATFHPNNPTAIDVTDEAPRGHWSARGYNLFTGS